MIGKPSVSAGFTRIGSPALGVGQSEGGFSWSSYWTQRSEEWITSRSGLDLIDVLTGTAKAFILLPTFYKALTAAEITGDKTRSSERVFDGNSYTIYMKFEQHTQITGTHSFILLGGGSLLSHRGINLIVSTDRLRFYIADGVVLYRPYLTNAGLNALTWGNGVFELYIQVDFTNKLFLANLYDSTGASVGTPVSQDISAFVFNSNDNQVNYSFPSQIYDIEGLKKFTGLKTIAQCRDDSYVTDLQIHIPLTLSGVDVSGNGNHFNRATLTTASKVYRRIINYPLDYGYTINRLTDDVTNPIPVIASHDVSGNYIYPTDPTYNQTAYQRTHEGSGSLTSHNMIDCKIRFTNAFFDRSDVTIWNATCRAASDYDATNTKNFHIDNLNQKTIYSWLNDGYRGRLIIKMTPNSIVQNQGGKAYIRDAQTLDEIILLTDDEKGSANKKALIYTGDNIGVLSAYDAEGYAQIGTLKTNRGMFTIRIDDAYDDAYDNWRGVMAGLGVDPTTNVHSSLPGTNDGTYYWMSWDRLRTLQSEGWEICSSGQLDNDWNAGGVSKADIESQLSLSKTEIESQGLTCNHLVPNKNGIARLDVRYWAKKYGYHTCHAGFTYGSTHGCNPQIVDLFNLCAMYCDQGPGGTYNIDALNPVAEIAAIEAQLDYALANNAWAIMYVHMSSANLITHLTTVIQYAQAIGLINVTLEGALANMSYQ